MPRVGIQKICPHNCPLGSITSAFWGDGTYSEFFVTSFLNNGSRRLLCQDYLFSADVFSSENVASVVLPYAHELSFMSNCFSHVFRLCLSVSVTRLEAVCSFVCAVWRVRYPRRNNSPIFAAVSNFWQNFFCLYLFFTFSFHLLYSFSSESSFFLFKSAIASISSLELFLVPYFLQSLFCCRNWFLDSTSIALASLLLVCPLPLISFILFMRYCQSVAIADLTRGLGSICILNFVAIFWTSMLFHHSFRRCSWFFPVPLLFLKIIPLFLNLKPRFCFLFFVFAPDLSPRSLS